MQLASLLALPLLVSCCHAWLFFSDDDDIQTATAVDRPIQQSCLDHISTSNCAFYTCFDQRLPCGREGYMLRHGAYYCNRMQGEKSNFDAAGQTFIDDAQRCMMTHIRPHYSTEYFDCHDFEHAAVANVTQCFIDNNFCGVFRDNAQAFHSLFAMRDLFNSGANKIWRAVLTLSTRCAREYFAASISNTNSQLSRHHSDLVESLSNTRDQLVESLADTHGDVMESLQETRDRIAGSFSSMLDSFTGSDSDEE